MPHSSGGGSGSHGGGGHSYHSGSGGSGGSRGGSFSGDSGYGNGYYGGSPPRFSRGYYAGAKRFRYHWRGQDRYFYSMYNEEHLVRPSRGLIYIPMVLAVLAFMFWPALKGLKKYDRDILVIDRANVLENSRNLDASLNAFSEKTKITPAVITLHNEDWNRLGMTLQDYAYSQYLMNFQDEKHWLIMYSEAKDKQGEWEWHWEGMQGNDTDPVLTPYVTEAFNQTMQSGLVAEESPVPDIMADAFNAATARAGTLRVRLDDTRLLIGGLALLALGISAFFSMGLHRWKYRNAVYDPENFGGGPEDDYRQIPAYLSAPAAAPATPQPLRQRQTEMASVALPKPPARTCRYCGMQNTTGAAICPSCGAALTDDL